MRSRWLDRIDDYRRRRRSRRQLLALEDYLLRDIGVSRAEAQHEGNTPFWKTSRPPRDRRRHR